MEKLSKNAWHYSQYLWHKKRAGKFGWHKLQARWHSERMAFSYMVAVTLRRHHKALVKNLTAHNSFLQRLMKK